MVMAKQEKSYSVKTSYSRSWSGNTAESTVTGTLAELIKYFSYTLEVGESWQDEKGNRRINRNPKTIKSLITNLNNAKTNAAANGYSGYNFELVETVYKIRQDKVEA